MSSSVTTIIEFLETQILDAVSGIKKSPHFHDLRKNPGTRDDYVFAIRPGSFYPISGTTRSVTLQQNFEVELSRDFSSIDKNDVALQAAIDQIYADNEKIAEQVSLKRSSVILVVGQPSGEVPEVNVNGRSVSITFTYPIQYRKPIQGD